MAATLKDVAKKAGVAISTVSYVLNGTGLHKVGEETQKRIFKAAAELEYTPNLAGRILNGGRSNIIGITIPLRMPLVYNEVPFRIVDQLRKKGYQSAISVASTPEGLAEAKNDLLARHVEGMLFFNCQTMLKPWYSSCSVPILHFDGLNGEIRIDLAGGEYCAVRHLMECHGHRRIGFFSIVPQSLPGDKYDGYRRALEESGVRDYQDWIIATDGNRHWEKELLDKIRKYRLTAFACNNDNYASILIATLIAHKIRIPEDIAVVGYDGDCYIPHLAVPLTTMIQPISEVIFRMTGQIIEKVSRQIRSELEPMTLKPYLHIGRSCGCSGTMKKNPDLFNGYSLDLCHTKKQIRQKPLFQGKKRQ